MHLNLLHRHKAFPWLIVTKVVLVCIPVILGVALLNDHLFFTQHLSYRYLPGKVGHAVVPKIPAQLLRTADAALRWRISVDSLLVNVTIPRLIEAVRVRVRLNPGTQPYVALTAQAKKGSERTTIIHAAALESLDWKHVHEGNITLWMREKQVTEEKVTTGTGKNAKTTTVTTERPVQQYASVSEFRSNPPDLSMVGLVGLERMAFAKVDGYAPSSSPISVGHTLRGSHQLYVYAANETLQLTFDKRDLNRSSGTDGVTIRVAKVDNLSTTHRTWIKTITVGDDGNSGKNGPSGKSQPVNLELPNVEPGIYLIDIATSTDVLLANMTSRQHLVSFTGNVYIAEGPAYAEASFTPVVMKANGTSVTVAANHDQGKQDVTIGGKKIAVQDVKVNHVVSKLKGETVITIPKGDIIVSSDGLLSFAGATLLPQGAQGIDISTASPDLSGYAYIIADYVPHGKGAWEADQTYAVDELDLKGKTLTFSIDSPGLQASGATVGLKDVRVTFDRGPFPWDKVWKKLGLKKS